jgi:D-alanyl-D-alanine dipeptidase
MFKSQNLFIISYTLSFSLTSISMTSCSSRASLTENAEESETQSTIGVPDERKIPARLLKPTALMSEQNGGISYCTLPAGAVDIALYDQGKYRIQTAGKKLCSANSNSFKGWVPAADVDFDDNAYFGILKRVNANSSIQVKMNYAGNQIFCTSGVCKINEPLYGKDRCYLKPAVAGLIQNAAIALQKSKPGFKLKLLDCYRPVYVQYLMAAKVSDPKWVSQPNPPNFGGHNGGVAVDLTLVDAGGNDVDMGSGFDEFTAKSQFNAVGISAGQKANRQYLRTLMGNAGLNPYDNEWWHFSVSTNVTPLNLAL